MRRQLKNTIKDGLRTKPSTYEIVKDTLKGAFAGGVLGYLTGLTGEDLFNPKVKSSHIPNKKVDNTFTTIYRQIHSKEFEENEKIIDNLNRGKLQLESKMKDMSARYENIAYTDNEEEQKYNQKLRRQLVKDGRKVQNHIWAIEKQTFDIQKENESINESIMNLFKKEEDYQQNKTNFISKTNIGTGIIGAFCGGYNGYNNAYKNQPIAHNVVRTNQQVYLLPLDNLPINVNDTINGLQNNHRSYMFIDIFEDNCDIHIIGNNSYAKKLREQLGLPKHNNDECLSNGDLRFDDLCNALLDIIPQVPNNVSIANLRTDLNNIKNAQPNNNIPQNNINNQRGWCRIF